MAICSDRNNLLLKPWQIALLSYPVKLTKAIYLDIYLDYSTYIQILVFIFIYTPLILSSYKKFSQPKSKILTWTLQLLFDDNALNLQL